MAFDRIKILFLLLCATVLVGVSAFAKTSVSISNVHIGVFNSKQDAQRFYSALPDQITNHINPEQLWLDVYKSNKGFLEHHINISNLTTASAKKLCEKVVTLSVQCITSGLEPLFDDAQVPGEQQSLPHMQEQDAPFKALGLRLHNDGVEASPIPLKLAVSHPKGSAYFTKRPPDTPDIENFSLAPTIVDTPERIAAKAAYDNARSKFLTAVQSIGDGINAGHGSEAVKENLLTLGGEAFEAAGSAYLSEFLKSDEQEAKILASNADTSEAFVHHVKKNLSASARGNVEALIAEVLTGNVGSETLKERTDGLMLSGARSVIDAGVSAAKRSDFYALRHLELEYNLNDFDTSYVSVLTTQPVYQSADLQHNIFLQGGGVLNERSVDIDDDVARHTLNLGAAYRYLTVDEKYLIGGNVFFDHQWPYDHSRVSIGADAKAEDLNFAANYYIPLTRYRDSRTDASGNEYEERVLRGYDVELGYTLPFLPELSVFGKGYQYFRDTDDDILGLELSGEYKIHDNFTLKGSMIEENGGRDGVELALQYRMPLYDEDKPNLALAAMEPAAGSASVKGKIFDKVRRENRIRVEERLKTNVSAEIITAQFSALSIGLPFDVGGNPTGAGVNLPFDTAITVPNGDFGIITFSNGAIANVSASGAGDVILEFNNTTLTVTATNGGFVQFISAGGGINTINVPGGTVNLLGTDVDITDDGVTTTIQVRAGAINVVPDVGVATLAGNQADIVSLTIATGATSLLVNPALETRQEAAYTNLDLVNPDPPTTDTSAPFINVAPALITGPQFVGNNADLRLTFTQAVTVAGAPFINGLIDANARTFAYDAGASTSTQLVFRHVYVAGDVGSVAITINDLDLNGGTIIGTNNTLPAITAFTPTVVPITDQTAPMLTGSTPIDNEPTFNGGGNIILNFDENVVANIGNITLTDTTDGSDTRIIPIGDAQVTIVGSTVTINPTGVLDLSNDYDLVIGADVIRDTAGNAFAGIASPDLTFTTSNDVTPPSLVPPTTPADEATGIAVGTNLVMNFDENVQAIAGNIVITDTTDGSDVRNIPIGDAQVSIVGSTITVNPTTDLEIGTAYDVTMAASVIEDLNGNDYGGVASGTFNFTTTAITSLAQVTGLATGNYIVTGNGQTFTGYVMTSLGSSWLLVGRGREGWEFDADGQATNADVRNNLGVVAGFSPAAYEDAIINDLITNAAIDLTGVEIRINRAADTTGTNYQEVLWRPTVQTAWVWSFDTTDYQIVHDVQASILGAASSSTRNTRDANAGNDWRRIFTWAWGGHASQQGFSYGSSVGGVNGNDANTFLWENGTENHAIPYAEVYIRVE